MKRWPYLTLSFSVGHDGGEGVCRWCFACGLWGYRGNNMSRCGHSFGTSAWYVHPRVFKRSIFWFWPCCLTPPPLFVSRATRALHLMGDVQGLWAMFVSQRTPSRDPREVLRASQGGPAQAAPQRPLGLGWNEQNKGQQVSALSATETKRHGRQDAAGQQHAEFAPAELATDVVLKTGGRTTERRRKEAET